MHTADAARYARWSAGAAALIALIVVSAFVRHSWQAARARRETPSAVPPSVQQQSAAFTFSKVQGEHTEFTVRAARATQFKDGDRSTLEDVWITMYGAEGKRDDNLRTHSCDYVASTGSISCAGEVKIDLAGANSAKPRAKRTAKSQGGAGVATNGSGGTVVEGSGSASLSGFSEDKQKTSDLIHVESSHVFFNHKTGLATTDREVRFQFSQGDGRAIGLRYDSEAGELKFLRDVEIRFHKADGQIVAAPVAADGTAGAPVTATANSGPAPAPASTESVTVSGSSLIYTRDKGVLHLLGPVHAAQGSRALTAGSVDVQLDERQRAQSVVAHEHPEVTETLPGRSESVRADELRALLSPEGLLRHIAASGSVRSTVKDAAGSDELHSNRADLELAGTHSLLQRLTAAGEVSLDTAPAAGGKRHLQTTRLVADFVSQNAAGGASRTTRIDRVTTPAATLEWTAPPGKPTSGNGRSTAARMRMISQHVDASFASASAGASQLRELHGTGGVQMERQFGDATPQTSTSREMVARFGADGEWATVDQSGDVRLHDADHNAQADRAHFDRMDDSATMAGSVALSDQQSRTTARSAVLHQQTHDFQADGAVITNQLPGADPATSLSPGPARISAEHLAGNTTSGHAVYSGGARMWQGDSLIQADAIEFDHPKQLLTATGRVHAVFPQARWNGGAKHANGMEPPARTSAGGRASQGAHASGDANSSYWQVEARRMTYSSGDGLGHLDGAVVAHSDQGVMHADAMNLFFSAASAGAGATGGRQLDRATANGNVTVDQEGRRGTSTRADYDAADGKFVLTGGPPEVHDASGNATTGRQLTFYYRDDTISIDSAQGMRTLTLHRIEK